MLMLKIDEQPTTKIDILHSNYKSKYSSYKNFIEFIEKIRKLYSNFSENIDLIFSKNFPFKESPQSSLYPLLLYLENHIKFQSEQFNNLSRYILKEIIETFKLLKDTNDKIEEKIYKELNELNKALKKSKLKLDENKNLYNSKMKNLEKLITEEKSMKINILSGNNDIKEKRKAINELITECKLDENKYEKSIEDVNNNLDKVREKEQMIIGFYKSSEQKRINKMKENMQALLNSFKEINNIMIKDIDDILKQIANVEIEKDIIAFEKLVEKNYKVEKNVEFVPYMPMANLDDSLRITDNKHQSNEISINYEIISTLQKNFKNISQEIDIKEEKRRFELRKLCFRLFDKEKNINFVKEDLDNLLSFIKNEKYRSYFLSYLANERTKGELKRSEKLIKDLSVILNQILILAEKEKNYNNAKNCLILSQTFYTEKGGIQIYLMDFIKDNKWIHSLQFWQEIIEIEIINDKLKFNEENPGMDRNKINEKLNSVYFSKIITYSHSMAIFNIDKKITMDLCQSLIERYKISDELKEAIFKTIEDGYNPDKKKIEDKKENDKSSKKKEESIKSNKKHSKNSKKNVIEDEWVIFNEDKNKNKKINKDNNNSDNNNSDDINNSDVIVDDFVITGNKFNKSNNDNNNNLINENIIENDNINIDENEEKKEIKEEIINKENKDNKNE